MRRPLLLTVATVPLILMVTGCGMNSSKTMQTGSQLVVTMGDAPSDRIIAFALTVNSMTLTGGSNPTIISTPTEIEFVRNAGTFQPLVTAKIDAATYTGATIMVSNPQVVAIDTITHLPVQLTAALSTNTVNVTFASPLTIRSSMVETAFDLDLANSVTISGNTATINPVFHVSTKIVRDQDNDEVRDVRGVVTNISAPNFTIASRQMDQMFTFATDSNTMFQGITGLSQLSAGMIVEVDAQMQSDGSFLAKRVEVDEDSDDGLELEGFITAVTGNPATQFMLNNEFGSGPIAALLNLLGIGSGVTVNVSSTTTFSVADNAEINPSGLSVSFDAGNIGKAQRVQAGAMHQASFQPSGFVLAADRVRLLQQSLGGTVSNLSGSTPGTFTLTMAADSAFTLLAGNQTTVTVQVLSTTREDTMVGNGASVRVRGLLFFNGSTQTYTLVASRISQM
jgi:Domain of unknown function (DUF5666)